MTYNKANKTLLTQHKSFQTQTAKMLRDVEKGIKRVNKVLQKLEKENYKVSEIESEYEFQYVMIHLDLNGGERDADVIDTMAEKIKKLVYKDEWAGVITYGGISIEVQIYS